MSSFSSDLDDGLSSDSVGAVGLEVLPDSPRSGDGLPVVRKAAFGTDSEEPDWTDDDVAGVKQDKNFAPELYVMDTLLEEEPLKDQPFLLRAGAVVRYIADLAWITFLCACVSIVALVGTRFLFFNTDPSVERWDLGAGEHWKLLIFDGLFIPICLLYGCPAFVLWWQVGWVPSRRQLGMWLVICTIALAVTKILAEFFVQPVLPAAYRIIVGANGVAIVLSFSYFSARTVGKQMGLHKYGRKFAGNLFLLVLASYAYYTVLPRVYFTLSSDLERAVMRVFVHPIVWELTYTIARIVSLTERDIKAGGLMGAPVLVMILQRFVLSRFCGAGFD
jgi:hypothetical protein